MKTINELVDYLKECDKAYYNTDKVLVSNDTYESLVNTLRRLDPTNTYLNKVGAEPKEGFSKVGRIIPMGTLTKYHTNEEVKEWLENQDGFVLLAPKYDGFGVELSYVNGELVMASTRGDGYTGEDITEAMLKVNYVPRKVPANVTMVRGEAIIPRINHEEVKKLGYTAMRNAVPGIVRSGREDALKYVDFVAYEFFDGTEYREAQRVYYKGLFNVERFYKFHPGFQFNDILSLRNHFGTNKDSYRYEIDGMVLKTDKIMEDDLLCPKYSIAWKFKSNRRETILRDVEFQLGVTGKFTPVGIFDPVEFQGAQLTRASLGSMDRYYDMKPCIGDTIEVSRRGDIIPYLENVVDNTGDEFIHLDTCPYCNEPLVNHTCVNIHCNEKMFLQIRNYVGTIGVKGIGPSLVRGLIQSGIIKSLTDIYRVTKEDIINLPRQGESSANKWNDLINKEISDSTFLCAMPFDNLGGKAFDSLLKKWSFNELMNLTIDEILNAGIKGMGESKVRDFCSIRDMYKDDIILMHSMANIK